METPTLANQPRKAGTSKPAPLLAFPTPAANPKAAQITGLQSLAREAYAKGNYAEPVEANAITYSKHVLELAPSDGYAKTLLENSVNGGEYQAQQAIRRKDFATAHRVANALAQLLPGRNDIAELQKDISIAEAANDSARRSQPIPVVAFRAYHLHSDKAPEDGGPHCLGTLSVVGQEIEFRGESASDEHIHSLDFTCSDIREIKKNSRVASRQGGFHVRTASRNVNFAPEDSSREHVAVLASACSQ